jgi:hypothetical protein
MKKYKKPSLVGLLLLIGLSAFVWKADPIRDLLQKLEQQLQTYRVNLNPEKIYVHLDKTHYVAGETVWMKAYLVNASSLEAVNLDEVVYVDLINRSGEPLRQLTFKAEDGKVAGQLVLPDSLEAGEYQLVAYTQWMRNFETTQFFRKTIHLWNAGTESEALAQSNATENMPADLQFFPEGGDMIAGVPTKVAFKAINREGLGIKVSGQIINAAGESLASFESLHAGMGAVRLSPQAGEQYTALVKMPDGSEKSFALPEVKAGGYALAADEYADENQLRIDLYASNVAAEPLLLTIVGNDQVVYSQEIPGLREQLQTTVSKEQLPAGINQIRLATADGKMLAERLVFMHPEKQLQVNVSMDEPEYLKREEAQLTITTTDAEGNPVPANLSMAVTDAGLVPEDADQRNIYAHLLLTSDLKGYVEQPDYYFEDITAAKKEALSYVMMTHGWRRFGWEKLTTEKQPAFAYGRESALSIDGQLVKENGEPVENGEVILYVKDQHETFVVAETDAEGYFSFEGFDFQDSVEVVIQGTTAKGNRNVKVRMDQRDFVADWNEVPAPLSAEGMMASTEGFINRSASQAAVEQAYQPGLKEMLLKEIIVQERRENIIEPFRLHQRADVVIDAESLPMAPSGNVLESLQGRIAGVRIYRSGWNEYQAVIRGSGSPLYLIDGMPVDASALTAISQFDLDRVEVIKGPTAAVYGGRGGGGVIALFTKRGGSNYEEVEPGDNIIIYKAGGFQQYREFYSPRYTADGQTERPDYRTTLYWNPAIQTDASGKASVSFYTADRLTDYRVVINGISDAGLPGSQESSFSVVSPEQVSP